MAQRPDFDAGVLAQLPCKDVSFERDVTEELWSEREKLFYGATAAVYASRSKTLERSCRSGSFFLLFCYSKKSQIYENVE